MFKKNTIAVLAVSIIMGASSLRAGASSTFDFESAKAGEVPKIDGITVYGDVDVNSVTIVDGKTSPPDPFNHNNQSIYISKKAGSSKAPSCQISFASAPAESGSFSCEIYAVGTGVEPGLIEIDLGVPDAKGVCSRGSSAAALQIWTNSEPTLTSTKDLPGRFLGFSEGTNGNENLQRFDQPLTPGEKHKITVSWDTKQHTYTVSLDGSEVATLPFTTPQEGVSDVRFTTSNNADTSYFIDNVSFTSR